MGRIGDITHEGVVTAIDGRCAQVEVEVNEACGACAARKACSLGTATASRMIGVTIAPDDDFAVGERVMVTARKRVGAVAVAFAYVVPLVVLLAALVVSTAAGLSDGVAALASLGAVAVYYVLLWTVKDKISRKISFTISKSKR